MRNARLDNIFIILVRPKHPGNIGSVARAMRNMGLKHLRLVAPQCSLNEESERMAKAGKCLLEGARICRSLKSAIRDVHFLVGTTGKTGGNRTKAFSPRELAHGILARGAEQRVGILFGPEDTGLVDEDLLPCQMLVRIPTDTHARSINLAQAVMIISYELLLASRECNPEHEPKLATLEYVEAMYDQLRGALLDIGFLHEQNARHMMFALRRLFGRAGLQPSDVSMLRGIARQIAWYGKRDRTSDPGPRTLDC